MIDDDDQEEKSDIEDFQCFYNTITKNTKPSVSRKDVEDLVEPNKLSSTVKDRFCDKKVEDD